MGACSHAEKKIISVVLFIFCKTLLTKYQTNIIIYTYLKILLDAHSRIRQFLPKLLIIFVGRNGMGSCGKE